MATAGTLAKALIQCFDPPKVQVTAQFNPKELQVDKSVSWTAKSAHVEDPVQEFKEPQSSSLSVTLYFDGYETKDNVRAKYVSDLEKMVTIDSSTGRPPLVGFIWGSSFKFVGVVESLSQKYTMFLSDGTPCRCEVGLKMKSSTGAEVSARTS